MSGINKKDRKILVYHGYGEGFVHDNIEAGIEALTKICNKYNIEMDASDKPSVFNKDNLVQYKALVFANTSNELFTSDDQRLALANYIESGGNFMGIHSASDSEPHWSWYWNMIGGKFVRHPEFQEFKVNIVDKSHPSVNFMQDSFLWKDECYYMNNLNPANHVLLIADLTTIKDEQRNEYPADIFGDFFPLVWCRIMNYSRIFYTALGHAKEAYSNSVYLDHLWGALKWVLENNEIIDYKRAKTESIEKRIVT